MRQPLVRAHLITSNEALELPALPARVAIVGGGHNGLVHAAYLGRAGKKVVVLEKKPQVADHYAPFFPAAIGALVLSVLALFGLRFTPW